MLAIYGGMAALVYLQTDSFRKEAPLFSVLPFLSLAAFTGTLKMKIQTKLFTASSFIATGLWLVAFTHFLIYGGHYPRWSSPYLSIFVLFVLPFWQLARCGNTDR
ncbi:hypothetical protein AB6A40_002248 [Gnathostoma spinigerum]|uniref:Uncharacterized protein n=1 Tax=Gnathostoma spinigerum TaxID=75299 RepID=A0ABD6E639_9BILA